MTCVRQIHRFPARFVLSSDAGRVNARSVVYAAGYESGQFVPSEVGSLHSTYAIASEPLASSAGWPDDCLIWETARPYFYARKTADGRAIIGGEDTEYSDDHAEEGLLREKTAKLVRRFRSLFPAIDFVPVCAWAGTFGETKDGLAYIGTLPDVRANTLRLGMAETGSRSARSPPA